MKKIINTTINNVNTIIRRASSSRYRWNLKMQVKQHARQTARAERMLAWAEKHMPNSKITDGLRFDVKMMRNSGPADIMMFR